MASPPHHNSTPTDTDTGSQFHSGVALAVLGTFLFALKSIFIKLAFAAGAEPMVLLSIRMWFALPFYVGVLVTLTRRSANNSSSAITPATVAYALILGFLGYYLASYLDLCGLSYISAQLERLTLLTYPTMVAFLAWMFLGEALSLRILLAIVLTYAGVWIMYGQEQLLAVHTAMSSNIDVTSQIGWGVTLVLGAAVSYSLYILFAKPLMQRIGSRQFTSIAMIGSTLFVTIHYAATCPPAAVTQLAPVVYAYGAVLAFVCTVLPSFMISEAIVRIGATRTTVIGTVGPVLTMAFAIGILEEPTSMIHIIGMLVAIAGVSLVTVR